MSETALAIFGGAVLIGLAIIFAGYRIAAVADRHLAILTAPPARPARHRPGDCEDMGPKTQAALDAAKAAIEKAVSDADAAGFTRGQAAASTAASDQAAADDGDAADGINAMVAAATTPAAPADPAT